MFPCSASEQSCGVSKVQSWDGGDCLPLVCQPGYSNAGHHCVPDQMVNCILNYTAVPSGLNIELDLYAPAVYLLYTLSSVSGMQISLKNPFIDHENMEECDDGVNQFHLPRPPGIICGRLSLTPMNIVHEVSLLVSPESMRKLMPELVVHALVALNYGPMAFLGCEHGMTLHEVEVEPREDLPPGVLISRFGVRYPINRFPVKYILLNGSNPEDIKWKVMACENSDVVNGTCAAGELSSEDSEFCLKVSITLEAGAVLSPRGNILSSSYYQNASDGRTLLCLDEYERLRPSSGSGTSLSVVILTCYTISIVCLLVTFFIYVRLAALRTVPGLMLMNLMVALFLSQLSYLLASIGLFSALPTLCQVVAAAQHYFWFCSFAWMAAMSWDIYRCLSDTLPSDGSLDSRRLMHTALCCWLIPALLPSLTLFLSSLGWWSLGYDGESPTCWMANAASVLYLFALPVFMVVSCNVALFVASLLRLYRLMTETAFAGRKELNSKRLVRCMKISSWMGISWLFGILPNVVTMQALWYVFAVGNAMQGVQILLAFGLARRTRQQLCSIDQPEQNSSVTKQAYISEGPTASAADQGRTKENDLSHPTGSGEIWYNARCLSGDPQGCRPRKPRLQHFCS